MHTGSGTPYGRITYKQSEDEVKDDQQQTKQNEFAYSLVEILYIE